MSRKTISSAEFIRHFGQYHDEARRSPITLTKHGRASVVVMSVEAFERLSGQDNPRRVFASGETPPDLAALLLEGIDRQIEELDAGKDV
jgi:prevent-host-death family protein